MRIGSVSGIAGRGDSSLIRPVPYAETLPKIKGCLFSWITTFFYYLGCDNYFLIYAYALLILRVNSHVSQFKARCT